MAWRREVRLTAEQEAAKAAAPPAHGSYSRHATPLLNIRKQL